MQPVDQIALVVALAKLQHQPVARTGLQAQGLDIGKRVRPVHSGLARAQQVQVGAVENKNIFHERALRACTKPRNYAVPGFHAQR